MEFLDIKTFLAKHTYINYCEAIVNKEGKVSYARPSHTMALEYLTKKSRNELDRMIPIYSSPLHWLIEFTGCAAIWNDFSLMPSNPTKEQLDTINILIEFSLTKCARKIRLSQDELNSIDSARKGLLKTEEEFNSELDNMAKSSRKLFS